MTDAAGEAGFHDASMTSNGNHHHRRPTAEQRAFFEALVAMRGWYASRGPDDTTSVIDVHHVIVVANTAMAHQAGQPSRFPES